jgi:hypothetical protein
VPFPTPGAPRLLAILANPPLTTSGMRTINRVGGAARILGCTSITIGNLFPIPSRDVLELTTLGGRPAPWAVARRTLAAQLDDANDVLLGWGRTEPAGKARQYHRSQVRWLFGDLAARPVRVWAVGDSPRHPSRWQRHTSSCHPGLHFSEALARCLRPIGSPSDGMTEPCGHSGARNGLVHDLFEGHDGASLNVGP